MGFKDWLRGNKEVKDDDDKEKFLRAMRMTVRDFDMRIDPKADEKSILKSYEDAVSMYGERVSKKFVEYRKKIGVK